MGVVVLLFGGGGFKSLLSLVRITRHLVGLCDPMHFGATPVLHCEVDQGRDRC